MPFLMIYAEEENTEGQKQKVSRDITLGVSRDFNIPEQAVRIIFQDLKADQVSYRGWLKSGDEYKAVEAEVQNAHSPALLSLCLVVLYTEVGKTDEQYQAAAQDIAGAISKHCGLPEQAVRTVFQVVEENRIASGGLLESSPEYQAQKAAALKAATENPHS